MEKNPKISYLESIEKTVFGHAYVSVSYVTIDQNIDTM